MLGCKYKGMALVALAVSLILSVSLSPMALAQAAAPVAEIIALVGQAEKKGAADTAFRPAQLKDKLFLKDQIRTLANSKAKLWFQDESILVLNENTTLMVERYLIDAAADRRDVLLRAFQGQFRFIVHRFFGRPAQPDYLIETATTVLGVRGTDGVLEMTNPDHIYNLESRLPMSVRNKTTGETRDLPPMNFIISEPGRPLRLAPITPAMLRRLLKTYELSHDFRPPNLVAPEAPRAAFLPEILNILPTIEQPPLPLFHGPQQPTLPVYHGPCRP